MNKQVLITYNAKYPGNVKTAWGYKMLSDIEGFA